MILIKVILFIAFFPFSLLLFIGKRDIFKPISYKRRRR